MARYIINDDDIESWITYLEIENKELNNPTIAYVIDEMKQEVEHNWTRFKNQEHIKDPEEWKIPSSDLPALSVRNSFALFLADFKASRDK
jgi:hypothetical protein